MQTHVLLQMELHVYPLAAPHLEVNTRAQLLIFYVNIQCIFKHLGNRMGNNALWSLLNGSLGTYLEWVFIESNMKFTVYYSHVLQNTYYSANFHLHLVQDLVRINNWWNLQSSPTATFLNTSISQIYAVILSVLYLVYRVSLQNSR